MMDPTALTLSGIFGPLLLVLGVWELLCQDNIRKLTESFKRTPGLLFLGGMIHLLLGLIVVNMHPYWSWNLSILVTLLGWILLIRGLLVFFFPSLILKLMQAERHLLSGFVTLIWGLGLCWIAFS